MTSSAVQHAWQLDSKGVLGCVQDHIVAAEAWDLHLNMTCNCALLNQAHMLLQVAEELRRRLFSGDPNQQDSAAPPTPWGAPSPAHHRHLPPTTPHPRRVTEVPSLSGRSMRMSNLGGMLDERPCTQNSPSFGEVPLVYKQVRRAAGATFTKPSTALEILQSCAPVGRSCYCLLLR
jgi:hypothetical protein